MTTIGLLCSEPIRPAMAGIGVRYLELARRLPALGFRVVLIHPGPAGEDPGTGLPAEDLRVYRAADLDALVADCDVLVVQGYLASGLLQKVSHIPCVVDLYDAWLIENLFCTGAHGDVPFPNDHAAWLHQLSAGDFFLCSSEEQRDYYLGFLTALGRVNPTLAGVDPDLRSLIDVVPFGVSDCVPAHRPLLPPAAPDEWRILFGGLYPWYDAATLLSAMELVDNPRWRVFFVRTPNPITTEQGPMREVEAWAGDRGWLGNRVVVLDPVPAERRFDLVREVDVLASPHRPGIEARLCFRTRYLDALAVGCPVIGSEGGAVARLLSRYDAGRVVPPRDAPSLAAALESVFARRSGGLCGDGFARLRADLSWENTLGPLVRFCREPRFDETRTHFTLAPVPSAARGSGGFPFRLRMKVGGSQ